MKKILLVLNHSLAGFGSDEQAQLKPSGKKAPLGPGVTLLPFLQKQGAEIVATLYCGDQYYLENEEGLTNRTCFVYFSNSRKKLQKTINKMKIKYQKGKILLIREVNPNAFKFKKPEE